VPCSSPSEFEGHVSIYRSVRRGQTDFRGVALTSDLIARRAVGYDRCHPQMVDCDSARAWATANVTGLSMLLIDLAAKELEFWIIMLRSALNSIHYPERTGIRTRTER